MDTAITFSLTTTSCPLQNKTLQSTVGYCLGGAQKNSMKKVERGLAGGQLAGPALLTVSLAVWLLINQFQRQTAMLQQVI